MQKKKSDFVEFKKRTQPMWLGSLLAPQGLLPPVLYRFQLDGRDGRPNYNSLVHCFHFAENIQFFPIPLNPILNNFQN
jgi:hypothetical protein